MTAEALVITCMDARLHRVDKPYLAEHLRGKHVGLKTWDLVALPGGCRGLAPGGTAAGRDTLLQAVQTAHDLHHVPRVFLINHSDCGAYGGAKAFPDPMTEYRRHAEDLRAARSVLREQYPNLEVRAFYATVEDRADGPFVTFDEVR